MTCKHTDSIAAMYRERVTTAHRQEYAALQGDSRTQLDEARHKARIDRAISRAKAECITEHPTEGER